MHVWLEFRLSLFLYSFLSLLFYLNQILLATLHKFLLEFDKSRPKFLQMLHLLLLTSGEAGLAFFLYMLCIKSCLQVITTAGYCYARHIFYFFSLLSIHGLQHVDDKLIAFCKSYEQLYGPEKCTPNMHLHCHIKETVLDYGPVYSTWCFAFEKFNGVMESFQKNWIYHEVQLTKKFVNFQNVLTLDLPILLPSALNDLLQMQSSKLKELTTGQGSLLSTHIETRTLKEYIANTTCPISSIDTSAKSFHEITSKMYEHYLSPENVKLLTDVYQSIYNEKAPSHIPMLCENIS